MGKLKQHYHEELEAIANAQPVENECYCGPEINNLEELCSPCQREIPDEIINRMANELDENTMSEREFWSKMNEIEEFYEEHYMQPYVTEKVAA